VIMDESGCGGSLGYMGFKDYFSIHRLSERKQSSALCAVQNEPQTHLRGLCGRTSKSFVLGSGSHDTEIAKEI
jgi:hypothetical protein